jgi:hypothetical protein
LQRLRHVRKANNVKWHVTIISAGLLLRDAEGVGVEVASISLAEIEQQERALEGCA